MKNLLTSQTFKCIDVIDENNGVVGRLNKRITNLQILRGIGFVNTKTFEIGGTSHDTNYYATKDNNKLGHEYNQNQFQNGNFIQHIYTTITETQVNKLVLITNIFSQETHDITIDICEVKHGPYDGVEDTDLPTLCTVTYPNITGNVKKYELFTINFTEPKLVTVRLRFTGGPHGNQVTMVSTLQAAVFL